MIFTTSLPSSRVARRSAKEASTCAAAACSASHAASCARFASSLAAASFDASYAAVVDFGASTRKPVDGDDHRLAAEVAPRDLDADRAEPRADDAERQLERRERRRAQLSWSSFTPPSHTELERLGVDAVDERTERLLEHCSDSGFAIKLRKRV